MNQEGIAAKSRRQARRAKVRASACFWFLSLLVHVLGSGSAAAGSAARHPNLLLNREEIAKVKFKIDNQVWAARLFDRVKELAQDSRHTSRTPREAALIYALTGDERSGRAARQALLSMVRMVTPRYEQLDLAADPDFGAFGPWATWAWTYDLIYDTFSAEEKEAVEKLFRTAARTIIEGLKLRTTTPNLVFEKHWKVGIIGYCLGDRELIDWALNDPGRTGPDMGGFYQVLDSMVKDGYFWGEAPIYALHYDIHGMLALAEAALHHDGTDLYRHVSKKSGGSIKGLIDGYLRLAYPLEKTGIERGSLRLATFGDGSTAYGPMGDLQDTFLINPPYSMLGPVTLSGELEVAYKRYRDPGYAWLIGLNPKRDAYIGSPGQGGNRPIWGYAALTHGEPLPPEPMPPAAPCGVYPAQGIAMLRSDESSGYWTSGTSAAVLRLGASVGHGHKDYYHLILHGKGRLLYPDLNLVQYEPTYLNWSHEGIAHNTLLVDHQSPRPGPFTTGQDFAPEMKFFAVAGSPFPNIRQTRALLLTRDYVADVFHAADTQRAVRTFDWVVHGLGRLFPGNPAAFQPTQALLPHYWWIDQERGRTTAATWQADWIQQSGGVIRGVQPFGKEWFDQTVGVRLTMLGTPRTEVYHGQGPLTDGPPYPRIEGQLEGSSPMVVARRKAPATTFTALHEPYDKRPAVRRIWRIQETEEAVGLAVESDSFSDRILVAFDPNKECTLHSPDGEIFTFQDHGYVRSANGQVTVRGSLQDFRLRLARSAKLSIIMNGKELSGSRNGEFLVYGSIPKGLGDARLRGTERPLLEDSVESQGFVHYSFLPEEVHLRAGSEQRTVMHLRCVGHGKIQGRIHLITPNGIAIDPSWVNVAGMSEGQTQAVRLKLSAARGAASALHAVRVEPVPGTSAAPSTLWVSVGVATTEDKRIPMVAQTVVRAPGYTMRVDHLSGVSYSLLDADGHRRHGYLHNTNFCYGIPALARDKEWVLRYGSPCDYLFEGANSLIARSGSGPQQVRLRYSFQEDEVHLELVPPTDPKAEYTMWLGNFDTLGPPQHHGKVAEGRERALVANWFFFPHPVYRQGVFLVFPEEVALQYQRTAVRFPLRSGQRVVFRFAAAEELASLLKAKGLSALRR
jgi:hypothetical protein